MDRILRQSRLADGLGLRGLVDALDQTRRDGMRHGHMRDAAPAEKARLAAMGAVDILIDQHEQAWLQLRLE